MAGADDSAQAAVVDAAAVSRFCGNEGQAPRGGPTGVAAFAGGGCSGIGSGVHQTATASWGWWRRQQGGWQPVDGAAADGGQRRAAGSAATTT